MAKPRPIKDMATPPDGRQAIALRCRDALLIVLCGLLGAGLGGGAGVPGLLAGLLGGGAAGALLSAAARGLGKVGTGALAGGAAGLLAGLAAALAVIAVAGEAAPAGVRPLAGAFVGLALSYLGVCLGAAQGARHFPDHAREEGAKKGGKYHHAKILDTSVIIDGRIADICEAGFVEGALVLPQFVLKELQQIADSSDSLKRNRGRRGLDILQRIQENQEVDIHILETDFPRVREVDTKLVLLGKEICGAVITNDFNLNKVAELQGVRVLNINELANAVKPVVLPGEDMSVFVSKEGKEHNQGVGYLDDGTMVVVDNARDRIGEKVPVSVTSVLQTTAGRMIFTKIRDEAPLPRIGV